jgi:hypothetical protein
VAGRERTVGLPSSADGTGLEPGSSDSLRGCWGPGFGILGPVVVEALMYRPVPNCLLLSYRAYATRAPTAGSATEVLGVSLAVSLTEPEEVSRMQAA